MEGNKVLPSSKGTWMVPKQNTVMLPGGAAPETIIEERLTLTTGPPLPMLSLVSCDDLTDERTSHLDVMALIRGPFGSKHLHRC